MGFVSPSHVHQFSQVVALMSDTSDAHGRCLCGGIRYAVHGELGDVINCHCERCRQFTGHHMAATSARLEDLSIEDADSLLRWFFPVPEAGYAFCSRCGAFEMLATSARGHIPAALY